MAKIEAAPCNCAKPGDKLGEYNGSWKLKIQAADDRFLTREISRKCVTVQDSIDRSDYVNV